MLMLKRIMNFGLLSIFSLSTLSAFETPSISEKMYIDSDEFKVDALGDDFYIHVGDNIWLVTNSIHRDATGLFSYECNLRKSTSPDYKMEYEKKWKCPYCYRYWPVGKSCGNQDCPSKYK